jgi:hypothetical protein
MDGSQLRRSQAEHFQDPETGIGFFAIPIMVLAGTPAGHLRRPAGMPHTGSEESKGSGSRDRRGPSWVCEHLLYEDQEEIGGDDISPAPVGVVAGPGDGFITGSSGMEIWGYSSSLGSTGFATASVGAAQSGYGMTGGGLRYMNEG